MTTAELDDYQRTRMILLSALGLTASAGSNAWLAQQLAAEVDRLRKIEKQVQPMSDLVPW